MSDPSDRDRVTAILTLADEKRIEEIGFMLHDCDHQQRLGQWWVSAVNFLQQLASSEPWLARRLLEALDTIDKARTMHKYAQKWGGVCEECESRWPCPTWQALNGGNESGDDR